MNKKIVSINGKHYDAHTGLALDGASSHTDVTTKATQKIIHHSQAVHQTTQKSHTLNRRSVKKIAPIARPATPTLHSPHVITRFARHASDVTQPVRRSMDIGPKSHPMVQNVHSKLDVNRQLKVQQLAPKPSQIIKQEALKDALAKSPSHHAVKELKRNKKTSRTFSIVSAGFALLLLGGYFTYLNMPNLSVRVAAVQAGVNANYPSYKPDGYSLAGPVAYNDGEVSLKFASNGGPQNFTITQSRSSWDSSAVQENYIKPTWGDNYTTFAEHGLTIYTNGSDAVWVNGGIRYTIEGDAPLSSSQIRSIATSM
jgi:hypothetical protein